MLALRTVDGKALRLSKSEISFVKKNHLLNTDNIPKNYSFPFVLPVGKNERLFDYMHQIDASGKEFVLPVNLEVEGNLFFHGDLRLVRADRDYYRATLVSRINTDLDLTKPMNSLFFGQVINYSDENDGSPLAMNDHGWPRARFYWPTWQNDDTYFNSKYVYGRVNPYIAGSAYMTSAAGRVGLNACLYLPEVLEMLCEKLGYIPEGTLFTNTELCSVIVWNNYVVRWGGGVINLDVYKMLPNITVIEFFNQIRSVGITTEIDNERNRIRFDVMNTIYDRRELTDVSKHIDRIYEIEFGKQYGGFCQEFVATDSHGSALLTSISDLVADHQFNYSFKMGPPGTAPLCYNIDGVLTCFLPGEIVFIEGENMWYQWDEDEGYLPIAYNVEKYQSGAGEIQPPSIPSIVMGFNTDEKQLLPWLNVEVSDLNQYKPFDLKLLFARGTTYNVSGNIYAFATPDNYRMSTAGPNYFEKYGKYSLLPNREDSVSRLLLDPYFSKLSSLKRYHSVIHGHWFHKNYLQTWNHLRVLSTNFIWEELHYNFSDRGVGPTEVKMLKIS